jgi:hypothetical protein
MPESVTKDVSTTEGFSLTIGFSWVTQLLYGVSVDPFIECKKWKTRNTKNSERISSKKKNSATKRSN